MQQEAILAYKMLKMYEDMELTEQYRSNAALAASPELEYTAQYNVHNGQVSAISAMHASWHRAKQASEQRASASRSQLRRSFTESYLEPIGQSASANATTTINLNSFNQQKRIQRLLNSVLGFDYKFPYPRQMKDQIAPPSLDFVDVRLFGNSKLQEAQLDTLRLSKAKEEADFVLRNLEEGLVDEADKTADGAKQEENEAPEYRSRALENVYRLYRLDLNFPRCRPYFGDFAVNFKFDRCYFTLRAGKLGVLRVFVKRPVHFILREVFLAKVSVSKQLSPVRNLIFGGIPDAYRVGFNDKQSNNSQPASPPYSDTYPQNAPNQEEEALSSFVADDPPAYPVSTHNMQILSPFAAFSGKEFEQNKKLMGSFLYHDFMMLLQEISHRLRDLTSLLYKVQARPELLLYLNDEGIQLSGLGKCVSVTQVAPLEASAGHQHIIGADGVLDIFQ